MATRTKRITKREHKRKRNGDSGASVWFRFLPFALVMLVVVVFEPSLNSRHKYNNDCYSYFLLLGLVESWTPLPLLLSPPRARIRNRIRNDGKNVVRLPQDQNYNRKQSSQYCWDNVELVSLASASAIGAEIETDTQTHTQMQMQKQSLDTRVADILEFVDTRVFDDDSSSDRCTTESILERVQSEHRADFETAKASCLEVEERGTTAGIQSPSSPLPFEAISISVPHSPGEAGIVPPPLQLAIAMRSTEPVLDASSVDAVTKAAENVWNADKGDESSTSRFTYQYSGNSEAHVFDFQKEASPSNGLDPDAAGTRAVSALNEALQRKIYPMIREAFFGNINREREYEDKHERTRLFVYDALVIRYNSTEAAEAAGALASASAGQPLHRDLGLVSVNIMLNSAEDFKGGGTFFENQLLEAETASEIKSELATEFAATASGVHPLKPSGAGYCLAHSASERHAGAGTTAGVRDILVLFVSAITTTARTRAAGESESSKVLEVEAPAEILSARLKNCRSFCERRCFDGQVLETEEDYREAQRSMILCRILHQRLAVTAEGSPCLLSSAAPQQQQPLAYCNGEALQYLGTALMEYSNLASNRSEAIRVLEAATECFEVASLVTPCDSRVYNNLGIVLGTIDEMEQAQTQIPVQSLYSDKVGGDRARARARARAELLAEQETAYRKGLDILRRSIRAGCTNQSLAKELESITLNYGLCVANQDRFRDATEILEPLAEAVAAATAQDSRNSSGGAASAAAAVTDAGRDAHRLWKYCRDMCLDEHIQEPVQ